MCTIEKAVKKLRFNKSIEEKLTQPTRIGEALSATLLQNVLQSSSLTLHDQYRFFDNNVDTHFHTPLPRDNIRRALSPLSRPETLRIFNTLSQEKKKKFLLKIDKLMRNFIIEQTDLRDLPVHHLIRTLGDLLEMDVCDVVDMAAINQKQLRTYIREGAMYKPISAVKYLKKSHPVLMTSEISKMEVSRVVYEQKRAELFHNMQIYMREHLNVFIYWKGIFSSTGTIEEVLSPKSIVVKIDDKNVVFRFKKNNHNYGMFSSQHFIDIQDGLFEKYEVLASCFPRDIARVVLGYM
jgi:hypothetical protein